MSCIRMFRRNQTLRILMAALVIVCVSALWSSSQSFAFDDALNDAAHEAQAAPQQQMRGESELPWLFAVYIITWGAFFGYVFVMSRRQREMRREIDALNRALAERQHQESEAQAGGRSQGR